MLYGFLGGVALCNVIINESHTLDFSSRHSNMSNNPVLICAVDG
jgi:hypothetical protein